MSLHDGLGNIPDSWEHLKHTITRLTIAPMSDDKLNDVHRQNGDMLERAAASMNMTPQDLLAPTPMTDLLRDVMSLTDTSSALPEEALPTFTTR